MPRARSVASARSARSRLSMRAEPKKTTVSWIFCSLKRRSGSRYSDRMRIGRASALSRKSGYRYATGCCVIQMKLYHRTRWRSGCYDAGRFSPMHAEAPSLDISIVIAAPPTRVLRAFFDPAALGAWWQVANAVTSPRALGPYVVEWAPTDFRDDVLGRLGGVFRGTVMQYQPGIGFFVADAYWLPPDGDPIGPMALEVTCTPADTR